MKIIQLIRPVFLTLATLSYIVGVAIAHYLGTKIEWPPLLLGLCITLSLLAASFLLTEFFFPKSRNYIDKINSQTWHKNRILIIQASAALLVFTVLLIITLISIARLNTQIGVLLVVLALMTMSYSLPPIALSVKGYGEILLAFLYGNVIPGISFLTQDSELHKLVPMVTFPLTLFALSSLLAMNFFSYSQDIQTNHISLLRRLSWEKAIPIHHIIIMVAYLFFASMPIFGMSWALIWPLFLTLPFGVLQILWLQHIRNGGNPFWKAYTKFIPSVYGLITYFLIISFWIR